MLDICKEIFTPSNGRDSKLVWTTTRRLDAEAGVSLAKMRRWYAPDGEGAGEDEGGNQGDGEGSGTQHGDWFTSLPPAAQREIEDLRRENAKARKERQKAIDDARAAEEKRLAEQNDFKTLADQRLAEIERLKPLEERFSTLEESTKAANAKRIAAIPETMRSLVPPNMAPLDLRDWLDLNAPIFAARRAPNLAGGVAGDGADTPTPKLTPEQQAMARRFGLTDAEYLKNMT